MKTKNSLKKLMTFSIVALFCFGALGTMYAAIGGSSSPAGTNRLNTRDLLWLTGYQGTGDSGSNIGKGICLGPDGRIFATGQVAATTSGNSNMPVVAFHPNGSIDWAYEYHGGGFDMGYALVADAEGNLYVAGEGDSGGVWRFTVVSINSDGAFRWVYHKTASNPSAAFDIIIAPDGHVYAGGVYNMGGSGSPGVTLLVSLTTGGAERWTHTLVAPSGGHGSINRIAADAESNIYAAGTVDKKYVTFSVTSLGQERWTRMYQGTASGAYMDNTANDIVVGNDGNIYVTGKFDEVGQSRVFMTMSFTSDGTLRWQHMHAGSSGHADVAWGIAEGPDGGIYVAGKGVEAGTGDVWVVIKYNYQGTLLWIHFENPTSGINGLNSLAVSQQGNVYACGWTAGGIHGGPRFGALGLTSNGDLLFTHTITPSGQSGTGDQVVVGDNGVAYMVGFTMPFGTVGELQVAAFYSDPANQPPYQPSEPHPADGASDVPVNVTLMWTGGDPDPGDVVTYDVYFGATSPPPMVVSNHSGTTYSPGTLASLTIYYWRIVAWDTHGACTPGPLWQFTTEETTVEEIEVTIKGGLGVNAVIKNTGAADITDLPWSLSVEGGFLGKINEALDGTIDIPAGESKTVGTGVFFGLGPITISVTVADVEKTATGAQIIVFSMVR